MRATRQNGESVVGNGVVVHAAGTVVTERSILEGAVSITVMAPQGGQSAAVLVSSDSASGIAVLRVKDLELAAAPLATGTFRQGAPAWIATVSEGNAPAVQQASVAEVVSFAGARLALFAVDIAPEENGAAIVDARGTVLGIAFTSEYGGRARTFGIAASEIGLALGLAPSTPRIAAQPARAKEIEPPQKVSTVPVVSARSPASRVADPDPADLPSLPNTTLPRDVYLGRFDRLKMSQLVEESPIKRYDAAMAFERYNEAYADACASELAKVETVDLGLLTQTNIVNGRGDVVETGRRDTIRFRVRKEFVNPHRVALRELGEGAADIRVLASSSQEYFQRMIAYRRVFAAWLGRRGCRSAEVVQFENNLLNAYGSRPPLQREWPPERAFALFNRGCSTVLASLGVTTNTMARCNCTREAMRTMMPESDVWDLEDEFTRERFVLTVYSKRGLRDKVSPCLA